MSALIPVILAIVDNGVKLWSQARATKFKRKHHDLLEELREAENMQYPEYSDAKIDLVLEKLDDLITAYSSELSEEVKARWPQ